MQKHLDVMREKEQAQKAIEAIQKIEGKHTDVLEEITKEQKKALYNFRDQVRYKDYKGLLRTLEALEPVVIHPERFIIPEKYISKYNMIQENILLLKNILISDIKYSITNEKALEKSVVFISTILTEKYLADVQSSIVTWMSNVTLAAYTKEIQRIERLTDTGKYLSTLLEIKNKVGISTAHLPIWWNISKVILHDLSVVFKNKLIRIIDKGGFSNSEYLKSLHECVEFEKMYLTTRNKHKRISSPTEVSVLKLSESSPVHLQLLDDISKEHPIYEEKINENSLSLAFIPYIRIYIESELEIINGKKILFSSSGIDPSIYEIYTVITQSLSRIIYFKFPSVAHAFLAYVDASISRKIEKCTFSDAEAYFISAIESIYYIKETTFQMLMHLESIFGVAKISAPKTFNALDDLCNRIYSEYTTVLYKKTHFLGMHTVSDKRFQRHTEELLEHLLSIVNELSSLSFANKEEILEEWLEILGQTIFSIVIKIRITTDRAEKLLFFMSALEVPLKNAISTTLLQNVCISTFDRAKLYLKVFLTSPEEADMFIANFFMLSNGIFSFHQIIANISKKYHKSLISQYNIETANRNENTSLSLPVPPKKLSPSLTK